MFIMEIYWDTLCPPVLLKDLSGDLVISWNVNITQTGFWPLCNLVQILSDHIQKKIIIKGGACLTYVWITKTLLISL